MGLLDRLTRTTRAIEQLSAGLPLVSPLAGSTAAISRVVFSEFFAGEVSELTREGALSIPPLKRGRDILVATIAGMQLQEWAGDAAETTPAWLRGSASGISPWHRMAMTVDDLIFYDWSAWTVKRDSSGDIIDGIRIPYERWQVDDYTGVVTVDGRPADASEIIVFPGNGSGGLLATGATTIKGYRALERSWIGRAQNPIPLIELHQEDDDPLESNDYPIEGDSPTEPNTLDEIGQLVDDWATARMSPTGAVGYTPHNIKVNVHGTVQTDLYVEGRNAAVLDVARLLNMPAALLDGSMSTASLTYSTTEGKANEFAQYSIPAWANPIEARLSLDDVSPAGRVIRFDRSALVQVDQPAVANPRSD